MASRYASLSRNLADNATNLMLIICNMADTQLKYWYMYNNCICLFWSMRMFNNNLQFNNNSNNFVAHQILYRHNKHMRKWKYCSKVKTSALTVMEPIPASTHKHLILESIVYFSNYSMNKKDIINRLSSWNQNIYLLTCSVYL